MLEVSESGAGTSDLQVNYGYNDRGQVSSVYYPFNYPDANGINSPTTMFTYGFDGMGRPNSLTDNGGTSMELFDQTGIYAFIPYNANWVQNVQYDVAGRMTSMQYLKSITDSGYNAWTGGEPGISFAYNTETRSYNANGQLASLGWSGGLSGTLQYGYSASQNNGQITQVKDTVSGETIAYQYDALKRLTSASSTPKSGEYATSWTQSFGYDGFGNMTSRR